MIKTKPRQVTLEVSLWHVMTPKCWLHSYQMPTTHTHHCNFIHFSTKFLSHWRNILLSDISTANQERNNKANNTQKISQPGKLIKNKKSACINWLLILYYFSFRCISCWSYDHLARNSPGTYSALIFLVFSKKKLQICCCFYFTIKHKAKTRKLIHCSHFLILLSVSVLLSNCKYTNWLVTAVLSELILSRNYFFNHLFVGLSFC